MAYAGPFRAKWVYVPPPVGRENDAELWMRLVDALLAGQPRPVIEDEPAPIKPVRREHFIYRAGRYGPAFYEEAA